MLFAGIAGNSMVARAQDVGGGGAVMPSLNYVGNKIGLSIAGPRRKLPGPTVRSETMVESATAIHEVTLKNVGTIKIDERQDTDNQCEKVPLDKFQWRKLDDGSAVADMCLTGIKDKEKIHIHASCHTLGTSQLDDAEELIFAIAAIGQKANPQNTFTSTFSMSVGPIVLLLRAPK